MKKQKLSLNELKVKSFVTKENNNKMNTIKGGHTAECDSFPCPQDTTNAGWYCGNSIFNANC